MPNPIPSGPFNGQGDAKVYDDTTTGFMELYQDLTAQGHIIMTVDGVIQSRGFDYVSSISDNRRIILTNKLTSGERVTLYYTPITGLIGLLDNNHPIITWNIAAAPLVGFNGKFTVEVVGENDTQFNNILYSISVLHEVGRLSYNVQLDLSFAEAGDSFRYRIRNDKWYVTIWGLIIRDYAYSNKAGPLTIANNSGIVY